MLPENEIYKFVSCIYIPICFYLNFSREELIQLRDVHLHSNMFLLKWTCRISSRICRFYLHSNMFLLKLFKHEFEILPLHFIYIPICFYLNRTRYIFHGNIFANLHSNMFLLKLTIPSWLKSVIYNLHSNMFLLKLKFLVFQSLQSLIFTFQYVST